MASTWTPLGVRAPPRTRTIPALGSPPPLSIGTAMLTLLVTFAAAPVPAPAEPRATSVRLDALVAGVHPSVTAIAAARDWTALELPPLCVPEPAASTPLLLADAVHVLLRTRGSDVDRQAPPPRLSQALVTQMLEEDARAHGTKLEFFRAAPTLLARGDDAAIAGARSLLADLRAQGELLDVEIACELVASGGASANAGGARGIDARTRVRSGGEACFGSRRTVTFVSGFDVEVAADSGVAQPILGSAIAGPTVHVRAARVDGGRKLHLSGVLDLSEVGDVARFDPDTPDLGTIEQPTVRSAQIAFAGVVDSGGKLEVQVAGSGLTTPDWKLVLTAATRPDPAAPSGSATESGWTMLDLAFLASDPTPLVPSSPGGHLAREAAFAGHARAQQSLPPAAVAASLEENRSSSGSRNDRSRAPLYWTNELLFLPRGEPALLQEARAIVRAVEATRLAAGRVEVRRGALVASFPVTEGQLARVVACTERPYVADYRSELAPQTWMPAPDVELACDGLGAELLFASGVVSCSSWVARSDAPAEFARKDAQLGKLQLLRRELWTDTGRVARKEPPRTLLAGASGGALSIALDSP